MTDRVTITVSRNTWMLLCDRVEALEAEVAALRAESKPRVRHHEAHLPPWERAKPWEEIVW